MAFDLLVLDDEQRLRELYARLLTLEGYLVNAVGTVQEAMERLNRKAYDLLLTDVRLPDGSGLELVPKLRQQYPLMEIVVVTAFGTITDGVKAMRSGAYDYLVKGDHDDRILTTIAGALDKAQLRRQVQRLARQAGPPLRMSDLIGTGEAHAKAVALLAKVAPTDAAVLLLGETGTGKELYAEILHNESPRSRASFVPINCAAIPKDMLESELFGYRKGAFTGALTDKKGLLEEADGGTLFLDELGEMPLELQAKLLRALDTQSFIKLGDTRPVQVNIRVVSATNRDLNTDIQQGRFRADLYYRLAVFTLQLAPLRERKPDILLLARHYLKLYARKMGKPEPVISAGAQAQLENYTWPGNIRELKNLMERIVILAESTEITETQLTFNLSQPAFEPALALTLAEVERKHILRVMAHCEGNKHQAAEMLGIGLTTLYRKLETYGE